MPEIKPIEIKQWEIYLIQFSPSTGHEYQKARPALVISSNELLKRSHLVTCIPFTSNLNNCLVKDDITIPGSKTNNLRGDGVLKMHHIATFDKKRILKYIGRLDEKFTEEVKIKLKKNFNL